MDLVERWERGIPRSSSSTPVEITLLLSLR